MSSEVGGNSAFKKTKRVFLHTTAVAYEGYAMCYNWDSMGLDAEGNAFTTQYGRALGTIIEDWSDARRIMVESPSEDNNLHFAGVVDECSDGVTGPNWIEIHEPGSVCKIYASLSGVAGYADGITCSYPGSGVLTSHNMGAMLTFNIGTIVGVTDTTQTDAGEFKYTGFAGEGSAMVLQVASDADQLIMAELMEGEPSGGVQCLPFGTGSDVNAGITIMVGGVTLISAATLSASGLGSAAISAGAWPGMKKKIATTAAASNLSVIISVHVPIRVAYTSGPSALAASPFTAGDTISFADCSNADQTFVYMTWTGNNWTIIDAGAFVLVT